MARRETHAERAERMKLLYDMNKHLSTLITGTALLLSAMLEKLFGSGSFKWIVVLSFILLGISLVASVWGMFGFAAYSRAFYDTEHDSTAVGVMSFSVALLGFCGAVSMFMVFAAANFIR